MNDKGLNLREALARDAGKPDDPLPPWSRAAGIMEVSAQRCEVEQALRAVE